MGHLAVGSVTTDSIGTQQVTGDKIGYGAVDGSHILYQSIEEGNLGDRAVNTRVLGDGAVNTRVIADRSVTREKLSGDVVSGKADRGAECQHDSGIWELAGVGGEQGRTVVDAPSPWVVTGIRNDAGSRNHTKNIWIRVRQIRNQ